MKIKIIELLNKSSNGEEMPKRIKYDLKEYFYCGYDYKIYDVEKQFDDDYNLWNNLDMYKLNDYVEIIEEPKKIEKLNDELGLFGDENMQKIINELNYTRTIINKLIDEINNLKEND